MTASMRQRAVRRHLQPSTKAAVLARVRRIVAMVLAERRNLASNNPTLTPVSAWLHLLNHQLAERSVAQHYQPPSAG